MDEIVVVVVDNRIRLLAAPLGAAAIADLKSSCEHANPDRARRVAMGFSAYGVPEKIRTWKIEGKTLSLPRGAMTRLRSILKARGIPYRVEDRRSEGAPISRPLRYRGFALRPHQREMVRVGLEREQAIIRGATGSGKTVAAFALAAEIGLNTLIILPTKGLFDQWARWAEKVLGVCGDALGKIQGTKLRLRPITIAMQASMGKIVEAKTPRHVEALERIRDFFGAVIGDEIQRAAAASLYSAFDALPAKYRIGFSASEKRKDKKEFLTYDILSKVAYEASRDAMTAAGVITDVEIRVVPTDFAAPWYAAKIDFNRLLGEMTADAKRNRLIYAIADEEMAAGEQVIVLSHRREHARSLEARFVGSLGSHERTGLLLGAEEPGDAEEFERARRGIDAGEVRIGIGTYGALGYGIDLPAVAVGIAATPVASNEQNLNQVRGRLCRLSEGKTEGRLYVLVDTKVFGLKPLRNLVAWNGRVVVRDGRRWVDAREYLRARSFRRVG